MNGIFAIEKPSGISSNQFLQKLKHALTKSQVFSKDIQKAVAERAMQYQKETGRKPSKHKLRKVSQIKMGHGGTLDPLASGVMIVGIGSGTKKLSEYLSGTVKTYESEALFGLSTTSGDMEGDILSETSTAHLDMSSLKTVEKKFVGALKQTPPIYAALKMNGKPLHEYAREGIPLPKSIEPRKVTIYELEIFDDSLSTEHSYQLLKPPADSVKADIEKMNANLDNDILYFSEEYCTSQGLDSQEAKIEPPIKLTDEERTIINAKGDDYRAPLLHFKAKVSSGTYIRSLVSDIGKAVRSSAYMVKLIRTEQQNWSLAKNNVFKLEDFTDRDEALWVPVLEKVLQTGHEVKLDEEFKTAEQKLSDNKMLLEKNAEQISEAPVEESSQLSTAAEECVNPKKRDIDSVV
ncbi:AaceriAEL198Wp [[Ashbya] aceris (nom. inval.)]|nr:AaceriAEL198Wp [[Ashbya] aceris (nom. inval.)]